jgi:NTP pyrophosphatase (non-canonical NTP hydrolase)
MGAVGMIAFADVMRERRLQDTKWGEQNHDDGYWLAILTEELGEAAQSICKRDSNLRNELVQVVAVAIAWIEAMDRRRCEPTRSTRPAPPPARAPQAGRRP